MNIGSHISDPMAEEFSSKLTVKFEKVKIDAKTCMGIKRMYWAINSDCEATLCK